jgi:hypothetical protein
MEDFSDEEFEDEDLFQDFEDVPDQIQEINKYAENYKKNKSDKKEGN